MLAEHPAAADPSAVFRAYEAERAPRTARVQTQARAWGDYWHLHPGPLKASRDAMLQARSATDYSESDWYYGYRGKTATAV
jgi:salicylate hydroxylase